MPAPTPRAPSADADLAAAADRLRTSARWLLGSFGAIAAVAFAGIGLSSLGSLTFASPDYRLTIALAGVAVGVAGIAVALGATIRLAVASTTTARI